MQWPKGMEPDRSSVHARNEINIKAEVTMKASNKLVSPVKMMEDLWAAWRSFALMAAMELDLFTHIASGNGTASEIARAAGAPEHSARRLLDAMVALKYLRKKGEQYLLEPIAETYMVSGRELYAPGSEVFKGMAMAWMQLGAAVRAGHAIADADAERRAREFFPVLVKQIFPMSFVAASAGVAAIPKRTRDRIGSILDVAAGSGAWSLAFARAIPKARVTALDYPEVTPITREYAQRYGVADRYDYLEGNLREVDFGRERHDLIILGHILHSEGETWSRALIGKCTAALRDKGMLLIAELIPNDQRTGPPMPLLFGLNMLVLTPEGGVFTLKEMRGWLKDAGFSKVTTIRVPAPSPLILATR